jgi:large subunit ribosomal protein L31
MLSIPASVLWIPACAGMTAITNRQLRLPVCVYTGIIRDRIIFSLASDQQSDQDVGQIDEVLFGYQTNRGYTMKPEIHPDYREVVFHDLSCDFKFITRSTIGTREKIEFNGKEYPLIKIEVSAESHPFYTGKHKIVDTAGRVEKFRQKFGSVGSKTAVAAG